MVKLKANPLVKPVVVIQPTPPVIESESESDEPEDPDDLVKRRRIECEAHAVAFGATPLIFDSVVQPQAMEIEEPAEEPLSAELRGELLNCIELHEMQLPVTWPPG